MPLLNLIFDIDKTLVDHTRAQPLPTTHDFFLNHGAILNISDFNCYVFPGTLELMRYLFSQKDKVRVSFFSAGIKSRNIELIRQLLILALGEDEYRLLEPTITVLSRENLTPSSHSQVSSHSKKYGYMPISLNKKDISKIVLPHHSMSHAILIDDQPSNIFFGQEYNYLYAKETNICDYDQLSVNHSPAPTTSLTFFLAPEDLCLKDNFQQVNSIYYLTGILSSCLDSHSQTGIQNYLFTLQFLEKAHNLANYETCFFDPLSDIEFYEIGLNILKNFNEHLSFNTPEKYQKNIRSNTANNSL